MTQIMQIANPMWYSDTFVFKEHKDLGTVFIKVNGKGKIEEIGVDIKKRMHFRDDIISKAEKASKTNRAKLNSIGDEYWWHVHNEAKLMDSHTKIDLKTLQKELVDSRIKIKRLGTELRAKHLNAIHIANKLDAYKDETPITIKWLYKNFPLCSNYCHFYYDYEDNFSVKINETIGEIRFVEVDNKIDGINYHHECVIKTIGQLRMFLTICGLEDFAKQLK